MSGGQVCGSARSKLHSDILVCMRPRWETQIYFYTYICKYIHKNSLFTEFWNLAIHFRAFRSNLPCLYIPRQYSAEWLQISVQIKGSVKFYCTNALDTASRVPLVQLFPPNCKKITFPLEAWRSDEQWATYINQFSTNQFLTVQFLLRVVTCL
jgi:hypothetical protein